jgi:hypothetical protein
VPERTRQDRAVSVTTIRWSCVSELERVGDVLQVITEFDEMFDEDGPPHRTIGRPTLREARRGRDQRHVTVVGPRDLDRHPGETYLRRAQSPPQRPQTTPEEGASLRRAD